MELSKNDAYEILELPIGAPFQDVLMQFKLLLLEWYPDRHCSNNISLKKFQGICQAFLAICSSDDPCKRQLLKLDDMLSLFQFIFFGNDSFEEEDSEDMSETSEDDAEEQLEEFYDDWDVDHEEFMNGKVKSLSTEEDMLCKPNENRKIDHKIAEDKAVQNAKELIQDEEREKRKAKKRAAQKKRRKEKKKQAKTAQKKHDESSQDDKRDAMRNSKSTVESSSDSEEDIDPESAFVATVAKKNKHIALKKDNDPTNRNLTEFGPNSEEEESSRVLRSRQLALRGNVMAQSGHHQEAVELFTEAIKLNSKDYRFYGNRSYCHDRLGNCERALKDAEKSIDLAPDVAKGHFRRGKALVSLKRYAEAEQCFQEVVRLDPACEDAVKELASVRTKRIMETGCTWEQAESALREHGSVEAALEALRPLARASASANGGEDLFLSDDEDDFLAKYAKPSGAQVTDIKLDPNNPEGHNSIWVGNLQSGVTEKILNSLFAKYGEISSVKFTPEKFYAFVNYKNKASSGKAMRALQGAELFGGNLLIRYPNGKSSAGNKPSSGTQDARPKPFVVPVNGDECYFWRTLGCIHGDSCRYKHIKEHKGIDRKKNPPK